ncbi:MAG TPA: hypothetical protein VGE52_20015 [Pirellulales bacterium]
MRFSLPIIFALVTVAGGCRVTMERQALERELREQEDRIYYLEDQLAQYETMLEASREQNAELIRSDGDVFAPSEIYTPAPIRSPSGSSAPRSPAGSSRDGSSSSAPSSRDSSPRPLPAGERPQLDAVDPPETIVVPPVDVQPPRGIEDPSARRIPPYAPPVIRPPDPRVPEAEAEPSASPGAVPQEHHRYAPPPHPHAPSYELPPELRSPDVRASRDAVKQTSGYRYREGDAKNPFGIRTVAQITEGPPEPVRVPSTLRVVNMTLDRRLTGGLNIDGRRGDEGVAAVVELRNDKNEIVNVPAAITVVVVDPSLPAERSRVARWDLKPNQTMNAFRKSLLGQGAHFQLAWAGSPPQSKKLQMHVRAITADGRVFRAERPIHVDLLPGVVERLAAPLALPVGSPEDCPPCDEFDAFSEDMFCPTP